MNIDASVPPKADPDLGSILSIANFYARLSHFYNIQAVFCRRKRTSSHPAISKLRIRLGM